jgi:chromosome segregation protein
MLKRLELVGFKSFAEKTQFDFPAGITAVVGPNGSGKSNLVDAVRWILGEQSAKSLRGGEMADVIFNGSTSRRSLGLAEVTMTFDNRRRTLATEAEEVQITRRVYRSGEGEYLINHQLCRLKDIKDLFLGSGAGADAYCVIEQGRVDVLLQASTKERRTIFEEAAGISRFKAKKVETLRKLEHVDQNLLRLKDIVEEVEKQLRSVKLQAAKAQRYQEYSQRLQDLRIALGLEEFQQLSEQLTSETVVLDRLRAALAERAAQAEAWEADTRRLEEALARLDDAVREQEGLLATARQHIAAEEATLTHEWSLSADLEKDLAGTRVRMAELNARVAELAGSAARAADELRDAEAQANEQRGRLQTLEDALNAVNQGLADLQTQVQTDKAGHLELMRQAARLHNDAVSYQAQIDNLRRGRERLLAKTEQAAGHLASLDLELQELSQADEVLQARLATARQNLADQRQERDRIVQQRDATQQAVADKRAQRSGLASRIEVLEGLERGHEGLGAGVREVIALLAATSDAPSATSSESWGTLLGMVADLLTVRHEYAALIDLVLGERAQRFLVRDGNKLMGALRQRGQPFSSRVSFVPLASLKKPDGTAFVSENPPSPPSVLGDPTALVHAGAIAAAEEVVTSEHPELADLPAQLLGKTLIVRDLDSARALAHSLIGYRFVTLQGELLEADGTLTAGTHHAETGILSRKSELRELREQAAELDRQIAATERDLAGLRDRVVALDSQAGSLQEEIDVLGEQAADLRSRIGQRRQRREGLHEEVTLSRSEISGTDREIQELDGSWRLAQTQADEADRQVQALHTRLEQADREIRTREHEREQHQQHVTAAKVALGKVEERLTALRARHQQVQGDLQQRQQERQQGEQHLTAARTRLAESQRTMLHATAALAQGYLQKESAERSVAELAGERDLQRQERQRLADKAQAARAEWRTQQEQAHARELVTNDLCHRRDTLTERLREDYQMDLADLYRQRVESEQEQAEPPAGGGVQFDPAVVNEEIAELRRKLSRLGTVNLDSLQELVELETRAGMLHAQSDDLSAAKRSLEEIIATINQDSRRLFTETFSSIRTHFQELFRKLFGGGMADIVLEDENDILESGIEIIARPPGKELRSISLMSGGEKTLTAVALLLAIFRSKPSPFCILDEVDAALDEANIGRFTAVLREFLDRSQFIIITHSKKTMAVADVLYGVTMQESGVSKRVAVRFEDWPEDTPTPAAEPAAAMRNGSGNGEAEHKESVGKVSGD